LLVSSPYDPITRDILRKESSRRFLPATTSLFPLKCYPTRMASSSRSALLACLAGCLMAAVPTLAQSPSSARIDSLIDSLDKVRAPVTAAISPDGRQLAWTVGAAEHSELHLTQLSANGSRDPNLPERLISPDTIADTSSDHPGACPSSHPAWSPDGKQLAFLARCSGTDGRWQPIAQDNIFVLTPATNTLKQVSQLHGAVSSLQWSPDGRFIAFLYVEGATRRAGALDAMKPWNGVYGEDGVEVQRVAAVDLNNRAFDWLTSPSLHAYEFSWSPTQDRQIAFVAAPPPGENNWWVAKLYATFTCNDSPVASAKASAQCNGIIPPYKAIFDPTTTPGPLHTLQIAVPRFSPDGKQIAFIGGIMSDQGSTGGDIYLIPSAGLAPNQQPTDITPSRPASPAYIAWIDDHDIGISEHIGGSSRITTLDLTTGKDVPNLAVTFPETIIAGTDSMSVSVAARSRNVALIRESFAHPPEVWAGPVDNLHQISHLDDSLQPAWGKSESIDYTNGGFHIQGWLLYPADYNPAKKYPLIVSVHGGPSSTLTPRWPTASYGAIPFSALGYFVFLPNPRGSFGQGEKFTQANIKDFGHGDLSDILAGVDLIEKRFPIDQQREGITGWSYGGYMTMFAVTQTTRFKAAVAGAGLANWQSYYGENSIDQWMLPFFGASVYDDPAVYAKSSPIYFIKNARTPTLMVVGDRDGECPAPQSFEFWHALRDLGVKTQLVIYPNEGHHFVDTSHQRDVLKRALAWFDTQMPQR
jgi:dipeptidyl aminopeptidase/acylaminoacyl peptidase